MLYKKLSKTFHRSVLSFNLTKNIILNGLMIFLCTIIFKPHVLSLYPLKQRIFIVLCLTITSLISIYIVILFTKPSKKQTWTFLHQIVHVSSSIFLSWFLGYVFYVYALPHILEVTFTTNSNLILTESLAEWSFFYVCIIGIIVYVFCRTYDLIKITKKIPSTELTHPINQIETNNIDDIKLEGRNKDEILKIHSSKLIYIKGEGHYANVYYLNNSNSIQSFLIRNTLKEIEKVFTKTPHIVRCHRSFIANTNHLQSIVKHGNKIHGLLKNGYGEVSVSKEYYDLIKEKVNTLN